MEVLVNFFVHYFTTAWANAKEMPGMLVIYGIAQTADVWSTLRFMRRGVDELNPWLDYAMTWGDYWWIFVKLGTAFVALTMACYFNSPGLIAVISIATAAAAVWNERAGR